MTEIDTTKLREIASAATPGPWFQTGEPWFDSRDGVLAGSPDGNIGYVVTDCDVLGREPDEYEGPFKRADPEIDAAFIAGANPSTVLAMCDEIDRLHALLRRAGEALTPACSGGDWGRVLAWIVNGATSNEAGIAAAKKIVAMQKVADAVTSEIEEALGHE